MIKLITPPGMLLTVALLVIYSAYALMIGSIEKSWILIGGGVISLLAAYGTAMLRRWSRNLVFLLATGFMLKLGHSIVTAAQAGYFRFQFGNGKEALWSLMPSMLMSLLSLICCVIVYRYFAATGSGVPQPVDGSGVEKAAAVESASE